MSTLTLTALTLSVTEADIALGRRNVPSCCPVARALQRAGYKSINVWGTYLSLVDPRTDIFHFIDLPAEMQKFIKDFDKDHAVKPTTFVLSYE